MSKHEVRPVSYRIESSRIGKAKLRKANTMISPLIAIRLVIKSLPLKPLSDLMGRRSNFNK